MNAWFAEAYREHRAARTALDDALTKALRESYPVGARVEWVRAGHRQVGTVWRHLYGTDIEARNDRTGAVLKITAFDIVEAAREAQEA